MKSTHIYATTYVKQNRALIPGNAIHLHVDISAVYIVDLYYWILIPVVHNLQRSHLKKLPRVNVGWRMHPPSYLKTRHLERNKKKKNCPYTPFENAPRTANVAELIFRGNTLRARNEKHGSVEEPHLKKGIKQKVPAG